MPGSSVAKSRAAAAEVRPDLSLTEAAEHFNLAPRTIRRYIAQGKLPAYRVGPKVLRIRLEDLENLMHAVPTVGPHAR